MQEFHYIYSKSRKRKKPMLKRELILPKETLAKTVLDPQDIPAYENGKS